MTDKRAELKADGRAGVRAIDKVAQVGRLDRDPELRTVGDGVFFFSSRRRHTRFDCDWSSDVCSSDLDRLRNPLGLPCNGFEALIDWRVKILFAAVGTDPHGDLIDIDGLAMKLKPDAFSRSEERRVGKECRSRWSPYH